MKILAITAKFPPAHSGGYGLRLRDIFDRLALKGHDILVLTTRSNQTDISNPRKSDYPVVRNLHNRYHARFFPKEVLYDLLDNLHIEQIIKSFNPDLIYIGHIYILSKAIMPYLSVVDIPLLIDDGGASLKNAWKEHGRWFQFTGDYGQKNAIIRVVKPLIINLICLLSKDRIRREWRWPENIQIIINSHHNLESLKQLGVPMENAQVIHSGVDLNKFSFIPREEISQPVRILCPGRIERRKGIMDSIMLVDTLKRSGINVKLTLAGAIGSNQFHHEVMDKIKALSLEVDVTFFNMLPQEKLINLYQNHDICFFPSYQKMGFSRTPLEAMACGCLLISYGNEGTDEVIRTVENGYLINPGDFQEICKIISNLRASSEVYQTVVKNARQEIEANYKLEEYIDQIEKAVINVVETPDSSD